MVSFDRNSALLNRGKQNTLGKGAAVKLHLESLIMPITCETQCTVDHFSNRAVDWLLSGLSN